MREEKALRWEAALGPCPPRHPGGGKLGHQKGNLEPPRVQGEGLASLALPHSLAVGRQ